MQAVVDAVQQRPPEAPVVDIGLPDIDRLDLAQRVVRMAPAPRPLLVAITGFSQIEDKDRPRQAGIDVHLTKPVDPAVLSLCSTARRRRAETLRSAPARRPRGAGAGTLPALPGVQALHEDPMNRPTSPLDTPDRRPDTELPEGDGLNHAAAVAGPAYNYGVLAFVRESGQPFEDSETELSLDCRDVRGRSTLEWDRARETSRDAWERAQCGGRE